MSISSPENLKIAAGEMFRVLAGGYSPPPVYGSNYQFLPGVPPFTTYAADAMLHDYQVKLAMSMLYVPVMKPQFALVGDPEICQFVEETMRKIWTGYIIDIAQAMPYTRFGAETIYTIDPRDGKSKFDKFMPFHPRDFRILTRDREIVGLRIVSSWGDFTQAGSGFTQIGQDSFSQDIFAPKSFVYIHDRRHGSFEGRSVLEGAYQPWLEKTQEGGAISSRQMWFYRCAFDSGVLFYPQGEHTDAYGNKTPWADVAAKILDSIRNGATLALENSVGADGKPAWRYEKGTISAGGDVLLQYVDHLDHKIVLGTGVPDDVITQNSGTGSYAGRTIPFIAFLESGTPTVRGITKSLKDQTLMPLVIMNFGRERGNDWDITEAKVNVDQFLGGEQANGDKGMAGDGDNDGVPNEEQMSGGGNGVPQNNPKQFSQAMIEKLVSDAGISDVNRNILKTFGRHMHGNPEMKFTYEGRNRTSRMINLPIQMSHDVSTQKRDEKGRWTDGGESKAGKANVVKNDDGTPLVFYRGSATKDAKQWGGESSGNLVFVTPHRKFAEQYASQYDDGHVHEIHVSGDNIIDIGRKDYPLWKRYVAETNAPSYAASGTSDGGMAVSWQHQQEFQKWLDKEGISYDGIYFAENDRTRSLAVKSTSQLHPVDQTQMGQKSFNWDEDEHPRDHGKFAEKPGSKAASPVAKKPANPSEEFEQKHGRKSTFQELHGGKGELIEKADKYDAANPKPKHTMTDVAPAGFGPTESNHVEDPSERLKPPDAVRVNELQSSINEAKTLLKGKLSAEKRTQIESSLESTKKKLADLQNHEPKKTVSTKQIRKFSDLPQTERNSIVSQISDFSDSDGDAVRKALNSKNPPLKTSNIEVASYSAGLAGNHVPDMDKVNEFAGKLMDDPELEFDPILIRGKRFFDGGHRLLAYKLAGRRTIPAVDVESLFQDMAYGVSSKPMSQMSQSDSEPSGHWITIGGHSEGKEKSSGGAKVFIGRNGKILKGPAALKGENVGHIGKPAPRPEKEQSKLDLEKKLQSSGRLGKYVLHSSHDKELAALKDARQERTLTDAEKDRMIALDVARHHDPHEVTQQGFRPDIIKHVTAIHKKARKAGESVEKPIDHASTREGIDARRAHAKAAGKTGHHYTEQEARALGSKEHIEAHGHAKQMAKEMGISTHDVLQNMESAHKYLKEKHGGIEAAKTRAREMTGLNAGNLAKIENAGGRDYSTVPGFDAAARSIALEHKELGLDPDDTGTPAAIWDLIREGKVAEPKLHDRQTAHLAAQWIAEAKKRKLAKSDHNDDEDTSFNFGFGKNESDSINDEDWYNSSQSDELQFGQGILDE